MSKFKPGDIVRLPNSEYKMRVTRYLSAQMLECDWADKMGVETTGRFPEVILELIESSTVTPNNSEVPLSPAPESERRNKNRVD